MELVVHKNVLTSTPGNKILEFRHHQVPARPANAEPMLDEIMERLKGEFGNRGEEIFLALQEAIINYQQHGLGFESKKKIELYEWRDRDNLCFAIAADGKEFDPNKVWLTVEERNANAGTYLRGRGHIIMKAYADLLAYHADGKSMYLGFRIAA